MAQSARAPDGEWKDVEALLDDARGRLVRIAAGKQTAIARRRIRRAEFDELAVSVVKLEEAMRRIYLNGP